MNENDFEKIDGIIVRHVGVFADSIQHKLDIVVEGHQMLSEKIDHVEARLDKRMDCLEHKLVAVAAETSCNTIAIRDLTTKTDQNTIAIQSLTTKTDQNTIAIQGLTTKTDQNTIAIQGLTTKTDQNTIAIQSLSAKLDAVAANLSAHHADTEAHPPVYRVKE